MDTDADGTLDTVYFVMTDADGDGTVETADLSIDDQDFGETQGGPLEGQTPRMTGPQDDERLAETGITVRLGSFYFFDVAFDPRAVHGQGRGLHPPGGILEIPVAKLANRHCTAGGVSVGGQFMVP